MKNLFALIFFVVIALSKDAFAQQDTVTKNDNQYRVVNWGLDEGLSQAEVYLMLKDMNGFLWIQTKYKLNRFDGNTFKSYLHDSKKSGTIAGDMIYGLVEDSLHNIWVGTDRGLSRYDIKADTFSNFSVATPFWSTTTEIYCLENEYIVSYDIHSFAKKIKAKLDTNDSVGYGLLDLYTIYDSNTNSIWFLRSSTNLVGVGLLELSLADGKKKIYNWPDIKNKPAEKYISEAMKFDKKRNCIWINTAYGLLEFSIRDKKFHHLDALDKYTKQKDYNRWVGIDIDRQARIWFATNLGIMIYNPADNSVTLPFAKDSVLKKEISFANACIYCDKDDITWSGFWLRKGIDEILPYRPVVRHYMHDPLNKESLNSDLVSRAVDGGGDKVWIGTSGGINILDTKTGKFEALQKKDLPGLETTDGGIGAINIDTLNQKAWLETGKGVFKADMFTKKCTPVLFKNLNNKIMAAGGGEIIVGKFDGKEIIFTVSDQKSQGVFVLNPNNDTAYQILSFPGEPFDLYGTVAKENDFLFLRGNSSEKDNQTYLKKNGKWLRINTAIDSLRWTCIFYNEKDFTYWIAGENQLFHYDKNFHAIKTYTEENGLPELPFVGVIPDNYGNIWFHTERSIHELNIQTGQIIKMSEKDGFEKQDFELISFADKDKNGTIYYGSGLFGLGLTSINPDNFISTESSVYLKSITINQNPFPLKESINYTDTLSLKYNQSKIAIDAGIIDFYSKGKSRIRYKLEGNGRNEQWQYGPYYYTIRYEGLQPGNYQLLMQASNSSNEFNGPIKSLFIYISPALWETWWFRVAALLFLGFSFYGFIRWRLQQRFRLQLERSEKETQIAEMKSKTTELEMQALRAQMNPHFIFNSLNSINRFILQNNRAQASEYLTKFSKLVRLILQNSQATLITLESELESLELYLNLESLRFNYHFDYKISVPKDMDIEVLKVPPLILQPYVENAIWHGLMHKEEKGQLDIVISEVEDFLFFKITDNGVGRKQAAALSSKSATKHKSMGLRITAHRIAILQNNESLESPVTISDLVNEDGTAGGTEVLIKMPVIYD